MIVETTLVFAVVAALGSIANIFMNNRNVSNTPKKGISIKKYMKSDLPVLTLTNNGIALNFLIDTGSNISHICPSAAELIDHKYLGESKNTTVAGLGGINQGVKVCSATFKDTLSREYNLTLTISEGLEETTKYIESATGFKIHGLLGTDFLKKYKYIIDFKTLEVYRNQ